VIRKTRSGYVLGDDERLSVMQVLYTITLGGALFRPDNPLLPNYKWVPIGYHGRASSFNVSGYSFHRPKEQIKAPGEIEPGVQPSNRLGHELEWGFCRCW